MPQFYRKILPPELVNLPWQEIDKCTSCIMACGDKPRYSEKVKCCTYYPFIPNYMVGNILVNNPRVSPKILNYIDEKKYTLPVGLCSPESYHYLSLSDNNVGFGKDEALLCPFYENGGCNIWNQRNSECLSFQCYSSYGERGLKFWQVLGDLIFELELYISKKMMTVHGFSESSIKDSIKYINYKAFSKMRKSKGSLTNEEWLGHWSKRSENVAEYYKSCYEKSLELNLKEFISQLPDYIKLTSLVKEV